MRILARAVSKGDLQELRLARVLYAEGAFVRRAIDLNLTFGEDFTVTDLDVWALRFAPDLQTHLTIGESKTADGKKGPKLADRLLWVRGLRELVGADAALVATTKAASQRVRGLGRELGVAIIDQRDLGHRERVLGLDGSSPWGPQDPELLSQQRGIYEAIKSVPELKRVYWFLRSEFWLVPPTAGLKRTLGALRIVRDRWGGQDNQPDRDGLLWLARQAQVNTVVALARLAGSFYRQDPIAVRPRLLEELAAGPKVDYQGLVEVAANADRFLMAVLKRAGVDVGKQAEALGALAPTPPPYSEPLIEVIERLAAEPSATGDLPRLVDWRVAEVELGKELGPLPGRSTSEEDGDRLLRLIGAFLTGQIKVPEELLSGPLSARKARESRPEPGESDAGNGATGTRADERTANTLFDEGAAASRAR